MNLDEQLIKVKKEIESIKVKKIQLTERLKALDAEKEQLLTECQTLGVEPQKIAEAIQTQEQVLTNDLNELSQMLLQIKQSTGQ